MNTSESMNPAQNLGQNVWYLRAAAMPPNVRGKARWQPRAASVEKRRSG
jgi:hypothetical protein